MPVVVRRRRHAAGSSRRALADVLVVMADRREQVDEVVVVQRVDDVAAVAAGTDEPQRAQQPQVMRRRAQAEAGGGRELLDRSIAAEQLDEHAQPARRRERLERLGEVLGLLGPQRASDRAVVGCVGHGMNIISLEHLLIGHGRANIPAWSSPPSGRWRRR